LFQSSHAPVCLRGTFLLFSKLCLSVRQPTIELPQFLSLDGIQLPTKPQSAEAREESE
jgi:hypothetical protein